MFITLPAQLARPSAVGFCCGQLNPDTWLGRSSAFAGRAPVLPVAKIATLLALLMELSPQDCGYQRSRLCTELLAIKINRLIELNVAASTLRRGLPRMGIVWLPTLWCCTIRFSYLVGFVVSPHDDTSPLLKYTNTFKATPGDRLCQKCKIVSSGCQNCSP